MWKKPRLLAASALAVTSAPGLAITQSNGAADILITAPPTAVHMASVNFDLAKPGQRSFQADPPQLAEKGVNASLPSTGIIGPMPPQPIDQVRVDEQADETSRRYRSFGSQAWTVKWEWAAIMAELTALHLRPFLRHGTYFKFENEHWLGRNTANAGMDKFTHSFNAYLATEIFQARMADKTNNAPGNPLTAAVLGMSVMTYGELYDGFEPHGGFSWQDMTFNLAGASLSVLRHSVPGLADKLDYRMLFMPNHDIVSFTGKEHFRQQRFLLALQLSGFDRFKDSPMRFVELHLGYYATGFTNREKREGKSVDRRPFVGIGINLQQLFFRRQPSSLAGRIGYRVFDYVQIPYTAAHFH